MYFVENLPRFSTAPPEILNFFMSGKITLERMQKFTITVILTKLLVGIEFVRLTLG